MKALMATYVMKFLVCLLSSAECSRALTPFTTICTVPHCRALLSWMTLRLREIGNCHTSCWEAEQIEDACKGSMVFYYTFTTNIGNRISDRTLSHPLLYPVAKYFSTFPVACARWHCWHRVAMVVAVRPETGDRSVVLTASLLRNGFLSLFSHITSTWRIVSSGLLRRVAIVRTDISEERGASFIRVTKIGALGTTQAATSNRRTLRRNTKAYVGC
jgi:hypothetical protein